MIRNNTEKAITRPYTTFNCVILYKRGRVRALQPIEDACRMPSQLRTPKFHSVAARLFLGQREYE
jgi:hypothetical protein